MNYLLNTTIQLNNTCHIGMYCSIERYKGNIVQLYLHKCWLL